MTFDSTATRRLHLYIDSHSGLTPVDSDLRIILSMPGLEYLAFLSLFLLSPLTTFKSADEDQNARREISNPDAPTLHFAKPG